MENGDEMENGPDPDLAAELRQGAGMEWAAEAAEDERLTELGRRRRLSLNDVAKEMVNKGQRASIEFSGHTFSGAVVWAGEDFATLQGAGQICEVRLGAATWSVLPVGEPADTWSMGPESLRAALFEHAESGIVIRLCFPAGEIAIGTVDVVADDHVEFKDADGRHLYVATDRVLAIIRSSEYR
jgi:hypothetical protein